MINRYIYLFFNEQQKIEKLLKLIRIKEIAQNAKNYSKTKNVARNTRSSYKVAERALNKFSHLCPKFAEYLLFSNRRVENMVALCDVSFVIKIVPEFPISIVIFFMMFNSRNLT